MQLDLRTVESLLANRFWLSEFHLELNESNPRPTQLPLTLLARIEDN